MSKTVLMTTNIPIINVNFITYLLRYKNIKKIFTTRLENH